jgi:hypothetical protein
MSTSVVRAVAVGASLVAAALYLLIGFGIVDIGESEGSDPALIQFGLLMGAIFAITAGLLWFVQTRLVLIAAAVVQVIVLIGYVAVASSREPAFELWGILVKVAQAVVLVAVAYLFIRGREHEPTTTLTPPAPTGQAS